MTTHHDALGKADYHKSWATDAEPELRRICAGQRDTIAHMQVTIDGLQKELATANRVIARGEKAAQKAVEELSRVRAELADLRAQILVAEQEELERKKPIGLIARRERGL